VCTNVSAIIVNDDDENNFFKDKKCYNDMKIEYRITNSNQTKIGFLRNSEIVTPYSTRVDCSNRVNLKEIIIQNKYKLSQQTNKILISNYTSKQFKLKTRNNFLNNLFSHHSFLTEGTDLIANLDDFLELNNDKDKLSNKKGINEMTFGEKFETITRKGGYFDNLFYGIVNFLKVLFATGKNLIALAFIIIISFVFIKLLFKCLPCCFSCVRGICLKKQSTNNIIYRGQNDNEIQMI